MMRPKRNATKVSYAIPEDEVFNDSDDDISEDFNNDLEPMEDSDGEGYTPDPKRR